MEELYNPFESMTFTYDKCFLCGVDLNSENRSNEHIYPRWLQNEFDLWDKQLILLNNTEIQYKNLFIPCCKRCNNDHLNAKVEKKIESAVKGGYEAFIELDESIIFKWLVKLSYGMLFKELSLKADIKNPNSSNIIKPEHLEEFKLLYTFLQTTRFNTEFISNNPWSILIFKIKNPTNEKVYDAGDFILTNNYDTGVKTNGLNVPIYIAP